MGKFEKLALLSVLFAAFLFMAFSGGGDPTETKESDPVSAAIERLKGETGDDPVGDSVGDPVQPAQASITSFDPPQAETREDGEAPRYGIPEERSEPEEEQKADDVVVANVAPEKPADTPATPKPSELLLDASTKTPISKVEAKPTEKRILQSLRGLRPAKSSDYMEYRVRDGDTWANLAQRFYRNGRYTRNLHLANEGLTELTEGRTILVPVYDYLAESGSRTPLRPALVPASAPTDPKPIGRTAGTGSGKDTTTVRMKINLPTTHTVVEGDNLSKISLTYYGTATRWGEIYEANESLLESADWLKLGMKLSIPKVDLSKPVRIPEKAKSSVEEKADEAEKKSKVD